jgi:hypothetical protein
MGPGGRWERTWPNGTACPAAWGVERAPRAGAKVVSVPIAGGDGITDGLGVGINDPCAAETASAPKEWTQQSWQRGQRRFWPRPVAETYPTREEGMPTTNSTLKPPSLRSQRPPRRRRDGNVTIRLTLAWPRILVAQWPTRRGGDGNARSGLVASAFSRGHSPETWSKRIPARGTAPSGSEALCHAFPMLRAPGR